MSVPCGTIAGLISSAVKAPRYGSGRAGGKRIVDGTDEVVFRKAQIAVKPATRRQRRALLGLLDATREVYNAALQERRAAYAPASQTHIASISQPGHLPAGGAGRRARPGHSTAALGSTPPATSEAAGWPPNTPGRAPAHRRYPGRNRGYGAARRNQQTFPSPPSTSNQGPGRLHRHLSGVKDDP